jgi:ABC-2 type transport system permease protein
MNKIGLVFRREYSVRIRSRYFWIGTLLGPLMFVVLGLLPLLFAGLNEAHSLRVLVMDPTDTLFTRLHGDNDLLFERFTADPSTLRDSLADRKHVAGLILPSDITKQGELTATLLAAETPGRNPFRTMAALGHCRNGHRTRRV